MQKELKQYEEAIDCLANAFIEKYYWEKGTSRLTIPMYEWIGNVLELRFDKDGEDYKHYWNINSILDAARYNPTKKQLHSWYQQRVSADLSLKNYIKIYS